ncbi:LysM peptidoglycan-binding domain-containing protein [Clostridiaceae bacterium M8S5]|nr:LysM peptidoglycan-binding domain-containing protein [Clostridiaceae bacterium M8S5]
MFDFKVQYKKEGGVMFFYPDRIYVVKPEDTLYTTAKKFNTSIKSVMSANYLTSPMLMIGQRLIVPSANIYSAKNGDSLHTIAKRFGTSIKRLMSLNSLTSQEISIGQRLMIPTEDIYIVKPGDTLYLISKKFNTTINNIIRLNNLSSPQLVVGQKLKIPRYSEAIVKINIANVRQGAGLNNKIITKLSKGARLPLLGYSNKWYKVRLYNGKDGWISSNSVDVRVYSGDKPLSYILGFYTLEEGPSLPSSYKSFVGNTQSISETALFMFRLNKDNPTQIEKFGKFTKEYVDDVINQGHNKNVRVLAIVHNLLYDGGTKVAKELVSKMLATKASRNEFIQSIVKLIQEYKFDGVNIDIEDVNKEDSDKLSSFYRELGEELDKRKYYFSASIPSRVSDKPFNPFSDPFNYQIIGESVDEFVVMLYNEHGWPGSGPGPVVSIGWMEKVLNYTITKMSKDKIVAAVSVFGFDFNITTGKNQYVTYDIAMSIAKKYNKKVIFDEKTKTPMFAYVDEKGNKHEVWFENDDSILAKIELANEMGIRGIALWRLGMEDSNIWKMLENEVVVVK